MGQHVFQEVPKEIREELFQHGCLALRNENWSAFRNFVTPALFAPFMYVFYNTDIMQLEIPTLIRVQDRLTVLDMLYNLGTPDGHEAQSLKVKMFETSSISIGESYVLKRVLRGFRELRSLTLWMVCDDAMLQILGVTCKHLENLDIWKSTNATDSGIRMLLGLDAERPFKVCSNIKKVAMKDNFLPQFLWRI